MAAGAIVSSQAQPAIVPLPQSIKAQKGAFMYQKPLTLNIGDVPGDSVASAIKAIAPVLDGITGYAPQVSDAINGDIVFSVAGDVPAEGYRLTVAPEGINVVSATAAGFFYGMQTLRQLLETADGSSIEAMVIEDAPLHRWRGFMLDEGRHIFGKDEVKRVLDIMALHKLNRFHWHLTEDQGWRIEIKKYPKLTEVGAKRPTTRLSWQGYDVDSIPYDGYYTQEDIKEIVAYAKDRFIEIVPEIDIPGHTQAAVAAYPEFLACDPENQHEVWTSQGVSADVMNVADPRAVQMSKDIIDELIELFPFPWLHLGGDECPTDKWEDNKQCQDLLKEIGSEKYRDLQLHFYRQLQDHIIAKQPEDRRNLIFWNEVLHGNTDIMLPDFTVMAWVGADKAALDAAERGFTTILSPQIPYYINRKQSESPDEPLSQGKGTETVERVYEYVPLSNFPDSLKDRCLGVQANFWSEYVSTPDFLEYLMLPRLAAVAEAGWTEQARRSYPDFRNRVTGVSKLYDKEGWNYAKHIFQ